MIRILFGLYTVSVAAAALLWLVLYLARDQEVNAEARAARLFLREKTLAYVITYGVLAALVWGVRLFGLF